MKFIHTSDWHLGRAIHGQSLLEDQEHVLEQFTDLVEKEQPDAVLVAGDVYDRSVPPHAAVRLLDDVLTRIVVELSTPIVMIAGNHDSPDRLAFGSSIFRDKGLFIFSRLEDSLKPAEFIDKHGKVQVFGLPFAEPALVREFLGRDDLHDHDEAMAALVGLVGKKADPKARTVLVAHAFVAGSEVSESERPLSVGSAGTVAADRFKVFDYTALGHLHRQQKAGSDSLRYSGSILKYSFSEAADSKGALLVETSASGRCRVKNRTLAPRRDMRSISGLFQDILERGKRDKHKDDYIRIVLEDKNPVFEAMGRIREVYPNVLQVERTTRVIAHEAGGISNLQNKSDLEMFMSFFEDLLGEKPTKEECTLFSEVIEELEAADREAGP